VPANEAVKERLQSASLQVDELRKKIVATKEGGMITGEERLREFLTGVYGGVVGYEGHPSQMQVERTDALARELADVVKTFDAWSAKELPPINAALAKKKLDPIKPIVRDDWEKSGGGAGGSATAATFNRFERD